MKKVLAVLRASTNRQEVESQKMELGNYLHQRGYSDEEIRYESYRGASASKANKLYKEMISDIKDICTHTEIKAVAFWHLNRLGRIEEYLNSMKTWFIANHIQVYLNNPSMQLLKDDGTVEMSTSIVWSMFAIMIAEDTKELLSKLKRGKEYNKKQGNYNGGNTYPFGFKVEDKKVVVDPDKAKIVNKIFTLYADGNGTAYISEYVKGLGYKIERYTINSMLRNESYKGTIIDEELYNKVKKTKLSNRNEGKNKRILLGDRMIVCPECGKHYVNIQGDWTCVYHGHIYKGTDKFCNNNLLLRDKYIHWICKQFGLYEEAKYIYNNGEERQKEIKDMLVDIPGKIEVQKTILNGIDSRLERIADNYENGLYNKDKRNDRLKVVMSDKDKAESLIYELQQEEIRLTEELRTIDKSNTFNNVGLPKGTDELYAYIKIKNDMWSEPDRVIYPIVKKHIDHIDVCRIGKYKCITVVMKNGKKHQLAMSGIGKYGFKFYSVGGTILKTNKDDDGKFNEDKLVRIKVDGDNITDTVEDIYLMKLHKELKRYVENEQL